MHVNRDRETVLDDEVEVGEKLGDPVHVSADGSDASVEFDSTRAIAPM